ncbi:cobalamin biosynthesis protein [Pseudomonas fragi]|uniref:cobalamin biosynthesis protein n=1 Tax=Pseudomonas fragi TaxID=296 RepID=UPI001F18AE97|nr:cobalamin biosynthesis protein [Pseudomonas fragi]MCF6763231.1 cobalamin biosynthesis protein [Pseudomonas fragi]
MTTTGTVPSLVIGLGCRRGCSAQELLALIEDSLSQAGIALSAIRALASIDLKLHEPGLRHLATRLNLELEVFSAAQMAEFAPQLSHRSAIALAQTGCSGIAESAALALAAKLSGAPAMLLITRKKSSMATFALACAG